MSDRERVTYRSVLANREFAAVLAGQTLSILGDQVTRLALALVVYRRTGSAVASAAVFATSYLTYLVAGPFVATLSDKYSRRFVMVVSDLGRAGVVAALAVSDAPTGVVFPLLVVLAVFAPAFDSARGATLPDILSGEAYVKGNAMCNLAWQTASVLGFVLGGVLVGSAGPERALLVDAGTFLFSAGLLLAFLAEHREPAAEQATGYLAQTREGITTVLQSPALKQLLGFALLGAVAVAAPESLAVPFARSLDGGSTAAGLLTAAVPTGFVVGGFLVLRLPPVRRGELLPLLVVATAVPLLLSPLADRVWVAAALWLLAGAGGCLQLVASAAYVAAAPSGARARVYSVATTSLMASQGLAQLLAGGLASARGSEDGPGLAVAALAVLVLLALAPVTRATRPRVSALAQAKSDIGR